MRKTVGLLLALLVLGGAAAALALAMDLSPAPVADPAAYLSDT